MRGATSWSVRLSRKLLSFVAAPPRPLVPSPPLTPACLPVSFSRQPPHSTPPRRLVRLPAARHHHLLARPRLTSISARRYPCCSGSGSYLTSRSRLLSRVRGRIKTCCCKGDRTPRPSVARAPVKLPRPPQLPPNPGSAVKKKVPTLPASYLPQRLAFAAAAVQLPCLNYPPCLHCHWRPLIEASTPLPAAAAAAFLVSVLLLQTVPFPYLVLCRLSVTSPVRLPSTPAVAQPCPREIHPALAREPTPRRPQTRAAGRRWRLKQSSRPKRYLALCSLWWLARTTPPTSRLPPPSAVSASQAPYPVIPAWPRSLCRPATVSPELPPSFRLAVQVRSTSRRLAFLCPVCLVRALLFFLLRERAAVCQLPPVTVQ